jgi:xanthine dehydrogenase accessory factor
MRRDILELASDLARRGEPFVLATVVARRAPISTEVGDMAIVTHDRHFHGWVGGSCTRPTVVAEAIKALEEGRPRLVALTPDADTYARSGIEVFPMTCHSGGTVEIYIQPVLPAPRMLIYGVSPVARALSRLSQAMGYRVSAVDPAADSAAFPGALDIATDAQNLKIEKASTPIFAVVATQGQWDESAILAALAHNPDYLAVVASSKRFAEMRSWLVGQAPEAALLRVKNPAGLDLGAKRPEEIALSILAEIVREHRKAVPLPPTEEVEIRDQSPVEARDPVCGMTVHTVSAVHRADHEGRVYFFCCSGCRERFLSMPKHFVDVQAAR